MTTTDVKVQRAIEQCRRRIVKMTGKPVTLVLFGHKANVAFTYEDIAKAVCNTLNVTYERTITRSRKREVVIARQLIFFYARNYTNLSHSKVAEYLGYRDHSTSIHSVSTVNELIQAKDAIMLKSIEGINQHLNITV
jgi:chromosomal replication initiation ATPase DnaA